MTNYGKVFKKLEEVRKPPQLVLFGKPILTEQQISLSSPATTTTTTASPARTSSEEKMEKPGSFPDGPGSARQQSGQPEQQSSCELLRMREDEHQQEMEACSEIGHCKVFIASEDVGRTLDLSLLASYDELCRKLTDMFGVENTRSLALHVLYRDNKGAEKRIGDEPYR